jgi:hypothetical protein
MNESSPRERVACTFPHCERHATRVVTFESPDRSFTHRRYDEQPLCTVHLRSLHDLVGAGGLAGEVVSVVDERPLTQRTT